MTAQRQERYVRRPGIAFFGLLAGLVVSAWMTMCLRPAAGAATTERVVVSRFSGLAIAGFDPVAYFADARPEMGSEEFEASADGVVWRFRNEGNRASFVAHPEIYGPQFGGYDPIDVARGMTVAGNPNFWLISGQRLYLFSRTQTRDAFAADAAEVLKKANSRWPELQQSLAE
jgi:hypothetical protein